MSPPRRPTLLVLRHHGLGDLLTARPALLALRAHFATHELVTTCPSWLVPLAAHLDMADRLIAEIDPRSRAPMAPAIRPTTSRWTTG